MILSLQRQIERKNITDQHGWLLSISAKGLPEIQRVSVIMLKIEVHD